MALSQREEQVYWIYRYSIERQEKLPTMRQIAAQLGVSYTAVHTYTTRIIKKGYLIRKSQNVLVLANPKEVVP